MADFRGGHAAAFLVCPPMCKIWAFRYFWPIPVASVWPKPMKLLNRSIPTSRPVLKFSLLRSPPCRPHGRAIEAMPQRLAISASRPSARISAKGTRATGRRNQSVIICRTRMRSWAISAAVSGDKLSWCARASMTRSQYRSAELANRPSIYLNTGSHWPRAVQAA